MPTYGEFDSPVAPGADTIELEKAKARMAAIVASQAVPAWTAAVVPWGKDAQGNEGLSPPGLLTGMYGGAGELLPKAANWVAGKAGLQTNLPPLPGAKAASEMFNNNARWALDTIPNVEPQNEYEQQAANMGFGGFSMALPVPGSVFSGLPRIVSGLTHAVVPTGIGGGAFGAAATGGMEVYQNAQRDKLIAETGGDPRVIERIRNGLPPVDLTQPDTSQTVAHPQTGAAADIPFPTTSTTNPADQPIQAGSDQPTPSDAKYDTLAAFGRPDIKILTPDFHSTGDNSWTLPEAIGAGIAGVAGAALVMRHGGKIFDPLIKVVTGKGDQINNVANVTKFNTNLDAVDAGARTGAGPGPYSGPVRGEAPLPGKAGSVMTNLAQSAYDKNRVLTEYTKAVEPNAGGGISPTTGVAKEMEATIGTTNSSTPMMNSIHEQMATGVNNANGGRQMPKLKGILQDVDNLTPDQQARLDEGLHMNSELNVRDIKFKRAAAAGQPLHGPGGVDDDTPFRHNYRNTSSADLRAGRDAMMNDPATADIARRFYALQASHAQNMFEMGRITQDAARNMVRDRPNHVPSVDANGVVTDPLAFTNFNAMGWDTPPTKAIDAYVQYYAKVHAELRTNQMLAPILRNAEIAQAADPTMARVVTEILKNGKPVESVPGRTITVYRDGVAHTYSVDNTQLHEAMVNGSARTSLFLNTADSFRRSLQSGTTGVMASVVGMRPFPVINLNRNIMQIATDRFPGTTFGRLDEAVQRRTGGFGYRGPEPTHWIGSYNEAIRGSAAVTARAMADALRRDGNPVAAALRQFKGDAWVKSWADTLEHKWATSTAGQMAAEGASGGGDRGVYTRPTYSISRGRMTDYNPMADTVPKLFHPDGITLPMTNVRIPGTKGLTASYINYRTWMRAVHQQISDGANAYYWKGMKDNPNISQAQRVYNTRQVVGDPSVSGAGTAAQVLTHTIPWINPTIQDAVRMMRNIRDNPVSFTLGTVHSLGMSAVASLLSAMLGGNRHLNMLGRLMATHDRASNVTFFHDPNDEHNYTQFSLPQRWRMIYPIILQSVADGLGALTLHQGEDAYNRIVHALTDLYNTHVSHSTAVASREGLKDFVAPGVPPIASLAIAATGHALNDPVGSIIDNLANGQPWDTNIITDRDKRTRLPGQSAGSSYVSNDDANWAHQVLKSVWGIAGEAIYNHWTNGVARLSARHDIAEAFGGLVSDAGQSWRDNAPFGNLVWGNNIKLSNRNPMEEANNAAWRVMSDPNFPKPDELQLAGLTRPGGVPVSMNGQPKINSDPQIIKMVGVVHNFTDAINQTIEPRLKDVNAQIKDMNEDPYYAAQDKRNLLNMLTMRKNEIEGEKNLMIMKLNAALSDVAGGKHVNITSFDPKRGMDQFHD
jgi:hypothetical protein